MRQQTSRSRVLPLQLPAGRFHRVVAEVDGALRPQHAEHPVDGGHVAAWDQWQGH